MTADVHTRVGWLLLGVAIALFLVEFAAPLSQLDDAYISYRYARNLVLGHGLVFNPDEYVEGFTNLLWVLLVAGGVALGLEAPDVGHVLGLASGAALLAVTALYAKRGLDARSSWLAGLAPLLLLASLPFAKWAVSGMETPLFAATCVGALAALERRRIGWATGAALVATGLRPEGALIAGVVLATHLHARGVRTLAAWRPVAVYAAGAIGLTLFRILYYGSPLPNTFYAKVGGIPLSTGAAYLGDFVAGSWLLLPGALIAALRCNGTRPGSAFVAALCVYSVAVGGDAFGHSRFLLPALACLCAQSVRGIAAWPRRRGWVFVALALSLPAAAAWSLVGAADGGEGLELRAQARRHNAMPDAWPRRRARRLQEQQPPVRLVAALAIGRLGYYSDLRILDLFGLTDPQIARSHDRIPAHTLPGHQRSNAAYVLARRPDYILIPRRPAPGAPAYGLPAVVALWQSDELDRRYRWDPELIGYRLRETPGSP